MSAKDLQTEIQGLRDHIAALVEEAAKNEKLFKKNQERELELLNADNLAELLDILCNRLAVSYRLEAVTLSLWDPDHETRHLLLAEGLEPQALPKVIFADSVLTLAPQFRSLQKPWLGAYKASDHQLLFRAPHAIKSIALIPLWRRGRLHGTLNFGSKDEQRFTRHLATDFLAHLGVIASFAIENAVNRARIVRSGLTDYLTGWHNRRYLQSRMKEELIRAQRYGSGVYCLIFDLDKFKHINDQYGHLAGDAALREAAQRINDHIRGSDAAARFGGDEFVVLAPGLSQEQALALAERIRDSVAATPVEVAPGVQLTLTVSIGVAGVVPARTDRDLNAVAEQLMARADAALYCAKQKGRNRAEMDAAK
jgi:diguanylate cyclase (GGDEF)-like protein